MVAPFRHFACSKVHLAKVVAATKCLHTEGGKYEVFARYEDEESVSSHQWQSASGCEPPKFLALGLWPNPVRENDQVMLRTWSNNRVLKVALSLARYKKSRMHLPLLVLQARVDLRDDVTACPRTPVSAGLCHDVWQLAFFLNVCRPFENVDVHAFRDVPCHMTVESPDTWIVELELNDKVALWADDLCVTALRIGCVADCPVPTADAFCEDLHVVAVNVLL
jgi:hypothetical protein